MATIKSGPLLVYEIPDAGGHGHRLLVPVGSDVSADAAAALIASIRGPVHLAADRVGVVRPSRQRARGGAIRDSSLVALIAGIDVKGASSGKVVSALAALEDSLDAVVAEAANAVAVNDASVIASRTAANVLDSIVELGFHEQPVAHVEPAVSVEPAPRPTGFMAALPHLAGTLAVFATGMGLGWAAAVFEAWNIPPQQIATPGKHVSATETGTARDDKAQEREAGGDKKADRSDPETPPTLSPRTDVRPATPEPRSVAVQEPPQATPQPRPTPQAQPQRHRTNPSPSITFRVTCQGTKPGERIQLLRCDNNRTVGGAQEARSDTLSFDLIATDGLSSPEQLKVGLWEKPPLFGSAPDPHVSERLERQPDGGTYACTMAFGEAHPRDVTVTVTPRRSAD